MKKITHVKCPACKEKVRAEIDAEFWKQPSIAFCDSDDGGCDSEFVLFHKLTLELWTQTLDVEGPKKVMEQ